MRFACGSCCRFRIILMKKITGLRPLFTREMIASRVAQMAEEITAVYHDEPLIAICVLKGGVIFFADLVRQIQNKNIQMAFLTMSSYGAGTTAGDIKFNWTLNTDIRDKHVLIVEDVVDTGHSMKFLLKEVRKRGPKSMRLAVMVDKYERREVEVKADYVGFTMDKGFIVGFGLDFAGQYRTLPDICVAEWVEE